MTFQCERCHFQFTKLSDLKRHYQRKRLCEGLYCQISYEELMKKIEGSEEDNNNSVDTKAFTCRYCNREYKWQSSLSIHYHTCKSKPKDDVNVSNETMMQEINNLKRQVAVLTKDIERLKHVNNPHIEVPIDHGKNIIAFGKEDLSFISDDVLQKHVFNTVRGMSDMFEHIHFNDACPSNKNILWKSTKNELVYTYNGNRWIETDLRYAIHRSMLQVHSLFSQYLTTKASTTIASHDQEKYTDAFSYWCEVMKTKQIMHKDYYQYERNIRILIRTKTQDMLL